MDLYLREGGNKQGYPEKNPWLAARKSVPHRGKNESPQPGIEPSPSNIGDQFAWWQRADSNPLNYWLPLYPDKEDVNDGNSLQTKAAFLLL